MILLLLGLISLMVGCWSSIASFGGRKGSFFPILFYGEKREKERKEGWGTFVVVGGGWRGMGLGDYGGVGCAYLGLKKSTTEPLSEPNPIGWVHLE
jgi:uncharacterized protein YceK